MTGNHPPGIVTSRLVICKDQVEIHRQAWHFLHKEIDGGATLQGESGLPENGWSDGKQQPDGIEVGSVHSGFRMRVLPFLSRPIQRPDPMRSEAASLA